MLDLHSIYKTFNAGTVNEKTALNGLNLHLNEGDFVTVIGGFYLKKRRDPCPDGGKRSWKIYHVKCGRRNVVCG